MAVNNTLSRAGKRPSFSAFITSDGIRAKINEMIGGKDGQRFITSIISAVSANPGLAECSQPSILSAAMLGESLKLSPSPQLGQYYMVPYYDKKNKRSVAQFQLGYKGYIQLAIRSGYYRKINVLSIKKGELIQFNPLEEEIEVSLIDDELERENARTIGYYAMFEYHNGFRKVMYWSFEKMQAHADRYSKAYSLDDHRRILNGEISENDMWHYSSFWYKDFDGMAYKTMLRQLISKWGIMSIEMQNAVEKDMSVLDENLNVEYADGTEVAEGPKDENPPEAPSTSSSDEAQSFFED